MRLNLGSGKNPVEDYTNIDFRDCEDVDLIHDVTEKLPYKDESIDEVFAKDVLEHVSWRKWQAVLADWCRVLKNGGIMKLRFPDIDRLIDSYLSEKIDLQRFSQLTFGNQDYEGNYHYVALTMDRVITELEKNGMVITKTWYDGCCDARITAYKSEVSDLDNKHPI